MTMKYTCTVCGHNSKNQGEAYRCQKQGRRTTKRKVGQVVAFCAPLTGKISTGQIVDIAFKRKTHEPIYTVKGVFGVTNVTEEDIRAAQTETA